MKTINNVHIGDSLSIIHWFEGFTKDQSYTVYGMVSSPHDSSNPRVMVLDDDKNERWIYLRLFKGFEDIKSIHVMPSNEIH